MFAGQTAGFHAVMAGDTASGDASVIDCRAQPLVRLMANIAFKGGDDMR